MKISKFNLLLGSFSDSFLTVEEVASSRAFLPADAKWLVSNRAKLMKMAK
jgi:hypothetical protein